MGASYVFAQTASEFVRAAVPEWLTLVFLGITRLGNVGVFMLAFTLDYWFGDHRRGAHAIGIIVGGMALITALKYFFAVPRPPETVNVIPISGYSFPSGHAMGSAIAYGTLAYELEWGSKRLRYGAAAVLVALIALSRVVLGVHYLRDVVAGVAFGLAFLAGAFALTEHDPRESFLLATLLAVVALVVSDASRDSLVVLGAAVGAALVWELFEPVPRVDDRPEQLALLGVAAPVLAGISYVAIRLHPPVVAVVALSAALSAGVLGAPAIVERLDSE